MREKLIFRTQNREDLSPEAAGSRIRANNRTRLWLILLLLGAMSLPLLLLRAYKLELIHGIVLNAVIQKAPVDYPSGRIEDVFNTAFEEAGDGKSRDDYLLRLLELSRRLEKIQSLNRAELEEMLSEVEGRVR